MNQLRFLLLCTASFALPAFSADKNVLFLICDDLNCDIACYGHPQVKTPNIDKLAARGVLFKNAHCQYPLCGPSRASFMTGLYPDQNRIKRNATYIRERVPNVKTIPQMFRDNGYFATRVGKIYHYNVPTHIGTSGHDDPYSWNYTINPRGRDVEEETKIVSLKPGNFGTLCWLAAEGTDEEQTDGMIATEAVLQLERYKKENRSFFLAVGLFRPHTPFVAPKKYFDLYSPSEIKLSTVPEGYDETIPATALKTIRRKITPADLEDELARQAIQAYYASISFADAQLGKVLEALDETGLAENTIVIFTSDHGYHLGEHGHWKKSTLFENATRVPLIIATPDQTAKGAVTECPAEMVDFYPTLAELCGLKAPAYISGVSLAPVLNDPTATPRDSALTQLGSSYSIRTPRYRYTEWGKKGADGIEFYDHENDPEELKNLADDAAHREKITELAKRLRERVIEANRKPEGL